MKKPEYILRAESAAKRFDRSLLFSKLSFRVTAGGPFSITGPNGSGKSTLVRIMAGLTRPTAGEVTLTGDGVLIKREDIIRHAGFISPYINPYHELTGGENAAFVALESSHQERILPLMERFGIKKHINRPVRVYSSGMLQRLKCVLALMKDPPILFLDEPSIAMDIQGREILFDYIREAAPEKVIILATNDPEEVRLCTGGVELG